MARLPSGSLAWLYLLVGLHAANVPLMSAELVLKTRFQVKDAQGIFELREEERSITAEKTAIVVCDMWDQHWCAGATRRVAEMAPRVHEVISRARRVGATIIHCPSGTMAFYKESRGRKLAASAPTAVPRVPLRSWCHRDPDREPPLPIDDSDGGCDCTPTCETREAWTRQISAIEIHDGDLITDSAEAYNVMMDRGITSVIILGVHTNMCVLGRPFSIRQLVYQGLDVLLMRDLTDTMYNSRMPPYVSHFEGNDLVADHIEKYWCPTITSADILGGSPFAFAER